MRLLLHGKDQMEAKQAVVEVLKLKPKMKFATDSPLMIRTYVWGLTPDREGMVRYSCDVKGTSRNPKIEAHKGGSSSGSADIRYDHALSDTEMQSFGKDEQGIWDFKVTVTDTVTGKSVVQEIKGVEVTK